LSIPQEEFTVSELESSEDEDSEEGHTEEKEVSHNDEHSDERCGKKLSGEEDFEKGHAEEEEDSHNGGCSDERCGKKLFPIAQQFKVQFTPEELRRMNIDLEKLLEINLLLILRKSRPFTSEEESLVDEAICALDRSPERRLLNAIAKASKTPRRAFEIVKSITETEDVDGSSVYAGIYKRGVSPLIKAAAVSRNRGLGIVRLLLDNGADIDSLDEWTALYEAIREENTEVVRLLIDRGANVNLQSTSLNRKGWTPLHEALYREYFKIARLLLDHGADPSIRDDEGKTPFDIAMEVRAQIYRETKRREFDEALNELHLQTP
jgi:hypothetical protein